MDKLSAMAPKFEPGRKTHPPKENYYSAVLAKVQKERDDLKKDKKILKKTIDMFESEVERLKDEVKDLRANRKDLQDSCTSVRLELIDMRKELYEAESTNKDLVEMNQVVRDECDYYRERNFTLNQEVSDLEHRLICSSQPVDNVILDERFIETTLKLKFIFDEIKKIGALPEDHQEWIFPLIEDIEIPEISQEMKEKYIPSYVYDPLADDGDDEEQRERIQVWNDEEETGDKMPYGLRLLFAQDISKANRYVKLMQSAVRKYLSTRPYAGYCVAGERSAILIQKIWRKYRVKPIKILDSLGGIMGSDFWIKNNPKYPHSIDVRFINTGDLPAYVQQIALNGRLIPSTLGEQYVPSLIDYRISFSPEDPESFEYYNHEGLNWTELRQLHDKSSLSCLSYLAHQGDWYQVRYVYSESDKTEKIKYLHIPPNILTGVVEEASYYYSCTPIEYTVDLNTGICIKDMKNLLDLLTCQSASEFNSPSIVNVFRKRWDLPLM